LILFLCSSIKAQAEVVKAAIAEDGAVMAVQAASLASKQVESEKFRVGQGCGIPFQESVEARTAPHDRPLEAGHGFDHPRKLDRAARKGIGKELSVAVAPGEQLLDFVGPGSHLLRIGHRLFGLLLEAVDPAIPEEVRLIRNIADRGRVPGGRWAVGLADGPAIGPAEARLVAGDTRDLSACG